MNIAANTLFSEHKEKAVDFTNLTNINFKDKNLIDLWKHFPGLEIIVSIDGYGEVNDYIRSGSHYNII